VDVHVSNYVGPLKFLFWNLFFIFFYRIILEFQKFIFIVFFSFGFEEFAAEYISGGVIIVVYCIVQELFKRDSNSFTVVCDSTFVLHMALVYHQPLRV